LLPPPPMPLLIVSTSAFVTDGNEEPLTDQRNLDARQHGTTSM